MDLVYGFLVECIEWLNVPRHRLKLARNIQIENTQPIRLQKMPAQVFRFEKNLTIVARKTLTLDRVLLILIIPWRIFMQLDKFS